MLESKVLHIVSVYVEDIFDVVRTHYFCFGFRRDPTRTVDAIISRLSSIFQNSECSKRSILCSGFPFVA